MNKKQSYMVYYREAPGELFLPINIFTCQPVHVLIAPTYGNYMLEGLKTWMRFKVKETPGCRIQLRDGNRIIYEV